MQKEPIKKYAFKNGLPLEFEILDLSTVFTSKKGIMSTPHRAQFYHILWIEKGHGTHFVDFKPVTIKDNTLLFISHNSVNRFDINGSYQGKTIIFTDSFFCSKHSDAQYLHSSILFSDLYDTAVLHFDSKMEDMHHSIKALELESKQKPDIAQYDILHNTLHSFLLQAEREMRKQGFEEIKPSANLDYLLLFKDELEKRFKVEKSVNKYANALSISDKQLHKATTALLDKTPKQIIDDRVLLEAKRLLTHGHQSIKEIAYHLGYEEPTNFIKYFRKHTHTTPTEFRELN